MSTVRQLRILLIVWDVFSVAGAVALALSLYLNVADFSALLRLL